jgi:hypothetical protein
VRAGWLLVGLVACSRAEPAPIPPDAAERSTLTAAALNAGTSRRPPCIDYTPEPIEPGLPGPLALEIRGSLRVELTGAVWRQSSVDSEWSRVGHVPPRDVSKLLDFARSAQGVATEDQALLCSDCRGGTKFLAHHVPGAGEKPLTLAVLIAGNSPRKGTPELRAVIHWLRAIDDRAPHLPRFKPFDLELPHIAFTQEKPRERAPSKAFVELDGPAQHLLLDDQGGIFRVSEEATGQRHTLRVGFIDPALLEKLGAAAAGTTSEPLRRVDHRGPGTRVIWYPPGAAKPIRLSYDGDKSERAVGPNSDLVVAWMYALAELAPPVSECAPRTSWWDWYGPPAPHRP